MPIDINKHDVDIDILFKQNENDLCSIKELYRKLKELEKKISQIKYIDTSLTDKLKKDYENLKRIIIAETNQIELINKINEINSSINKINNDINEVSLQLVTKANKNEIFSMVNMGQDIKEAMTGGSVAVVGKNTILTENIINGQVTPEKTSFINNKIEYELERGSIQGNILDDSNPNGRLRSKNFISNDNKMYILRNNSSFLIGVFTYLDGKHDGVNLGWQDVDRIELPKGKEIKFNVKKRDNSNITDDDIIIIKNSIEVRYYFSPANNYDVEKNTNDINAINEDIKKVYHFQSNDFEIGTISNNVPGVSTTRIRLKDYYKVIEGDILTFKKDRCKFNYGITLCDNNGIWNNVDYGWLSNKEFTIPKDGLIKLVVRYTNNHVIDDNNFNEIASDTFTISRNNLKAINSEIEKLKEDVNKLKNDAINSILIEYGRVKNASYVFIRIPRTLNNGKKIIPKVALTSTDGSLTGAKCSALNYARNNDSIFVVNGGLFNTSKCIPVGQLIIDGVSLINTPMTDDNGVPISDTECYPLAIDKDYNLTTYPRNVDTLTMLNDGVKYAVTGWGKLVDNFKICTDDINAEIVHNGKKYIRQSIGQFQNGDYCICSVDMTRGNVVNESGLYYEELAQIFIDKGVKFAYSLDGGGSTETVIGKRQLNPIYEGNNGRSVPTVIEFIVN